MAKKTQTSTQSNSTRCGLLNLLVELTEIIFKLSGSPGALCKALLPLHRRLLWSKVVVKGSYRLPVLQRKLQDDEGLRSILTSLTIELRSERWKWCRDAEAKKGFEDQLRALFGLLPKLSSLTMEGHKTLFYVVMQLDLLTLLPQIEALSLDWYSEKRWISGTGLVPFTFPVTVLPRLTRLNLSKAHDEPVLAKFLKSSTRLTRLSLFDLAFQTDIGKLLDHLHDPAAIKVLTLDGATSAALSLNTVTAKITEFISLRHLRLSDGIVWKNEAFFAALKHLPLEHLTLGDSLFDKGGEEPYDFALSLLKGSRKLPRLVHLTLDFLEATAGLTGVELGYDCWAFDDEWVTPTSLEMYDRPRIEKLVSTGEDNGVKVDGTAVQALGE